MSKNLPSPQFIIGFQFCHVLFMRANSNFFHFFWSFPFSSFLPLNQLFLALSQSPSGLNFVLVDHSPKSSLPLSHGLFVGRPAGMRRVRWLLLSLLLSPLSSSVVYPPPLLPLPPPHPLLLLSGILLARLASACIRLSSWLPIALRSASWRHFISLVLTFEGDALLLSLTSRFALRPYVLG